MATQRHFHPVRADVTKSTATSQLWPLNSTPMPVTPVLSCSHLGHTSDRAPPRQRRDEINDKDEEEMDDGSDGDGSGSGTQ